MIAAKPASLSILAVEKKSPAIDASGRSIIFSLTRRMAAGDDDSYHEFYNLYSHRLFAYLFVITKGNDALAGELLQQTMIRAARYVRVFEDEDIFWKWLVNLARSAWIDEGRKRNRYLAALEKLWSWSYRDSMPQAATEGELNILETLEALAECDRELLTKKYMDGLSIRELAEFFETSEKAIESRLTRARAKIKEIISGRNA